LQLFFINLLDATTATSDVGNARLWELKGLSSLI